jgi:multiple sugar transport system permease protein
LNLSRNSYVLALCLGGMWSIAISVLVSVAMSFLTGMAFKPNLTNSAALGVIASLLFLHFKSKSIIIFFTILACFLLEFPNKEIIWISEDATRLQKILTYTIYSMGLMLPVATMLKGLEPGEVDRFDFETSIIRFLTGVGFIIFTVAVFVPFYVMIMTSLKSQQELLLNPLNFGIDLSKGLGLFRSYYELFSDFNFGSYLWTSLCVSILTVIITLAFAIPGAYAVARLKFKGRSAFSQAILLIYMVPMIVLALPIYIGFSMAGLRNTLVGIVMIYPVTTIPVALYMLQGYFRGLPAEIEEAGLMDGLSRFSVIRRITLPLALPALASVSLYVFMIAWNEFLLALMLLDDPAKFTLTRGVASLNSSEVPRQHLMAGAVISTLPILILFLGLERFMTKGLAAGGVKG